MSIRLIAQRVAVLLLAFALAACAAAPAPVNDATSNANVDAAADTADDTSTDAADEGERVFRMALGINVGDLEVTQMTGQVANMMDYVLDTLVTTNADGDLLPGLAESWEVSEDGKSVTFNLREGVTFHDGTPFNADAVAFSFSRWSDPNVRRPNPFNETLLANVEVIDDLTIRVDTGFNAPLVLSNFLFTGYSPISPDSVENFGNTTGEEGQYVHPIGTGPYMFDELIAGEKLVLRKYEDYYGDEPYYDVVEFLFVPEAATRESLLLAEQVDMILLPPVADLPALEENEDVELLIAPGGRMVFMPINTADETLSDPRVRQALNYAVDAQAIAESLLFGAASPAESVVTPEQTGFCAQDPYGYDPDRARELLAEAGVENLELNFIAPTGRFLQDFQVAQAVGNYLQQVGITAEPATSDYGSYIGQLFVPAEAQTVQLHMLGFAPPAPDASLGMFFLLHNSQMTPLGLDTSYYNSEEVSALIDESMTVTDEEARAEALCAAQTQAWEDAPWIFLHEQNFPMAYRAGLEGITYTVGEKFDTVYAQPAE